MGTETKHTGHNTRWHVVRDAQMNLVSVVMAFDDFKAAFPAKPPASSPTAKPPRMRN